MRNAELSFDSERYAIPQKHEDDRADRDGCSRDRNPEAEASGAIAALRPLLSVFFLCFAHAFVSPEFHSVLLR